MLYILYNIVYKPSTMFHVTTWLCSHMTMISFLTLTLDPRIKKRKRKLNKKARVQTSHIWQIKYFGHSNLLYVRTMRAIINYTLIGEYHLRFFSEKDFSCPYSYYLIETRGYILYKCRRFNNYLNLKRGTISQFISFLEFHLNAFSFGENIT